MRGEQQECQCLQVPNTSSLGILHASVLWQFLWHLGDEHDAEVPVFKILDTLDTKIVLVREWKMGNTRRSWGNRNRE